MDYKLIQECIQKLAGTFGLKITDIISGEVTSVQEAERTCSVTTVLATGTLVIDGVNLSAEQNDGFIQIPAVDSTVLIAQMPDGENYVVAFSDIDKVICFIDAGNKYEFDTNGFVWNGGLLGGMAKTGVLATKYNQLEVQINLLKAAVAAINTAAGASPATPVTNAILAGFFAPFLPAPLITLTTQAEISDTKIKH